MYRVAGKSDVGCVRPLNQDVFDSARIAGLGLVVLVCDGMGGANAGEVASDKTRTTVLESLRGAVKTGRDPGDLLREALCLANRRVYELAEQSPRMRGMGTTAVIAAVDNGKVTIANVGDSRAYRIGEDVRQLTVDHSVVQMLVDSGTITPEEALIHPRRNLITRAVGADPEVQTDIIQLELNGGMLLLCSDGLSGVVGAETIGAVVREDPAAAPEKLIAMAMEQGSTDNITVVVVYEENEVSIHG